METLNGLVNELEQRIEWKDRLNTAVSHRDVAWHISHSLKVLLNISKALQNSNPKEYTWKFNLNRSLVFLMNSIPRGKGKAPKIVIPEDHITLEQLSEELSVVRQLLPQIEQLDAGSNFLHPVFGQLNLRQTKKVLAIHTSHHLKIIDDIIGT